MNWIEYEFFLKVYAKDLDKNQKILTVDNQANFRLIEVQFLKFAIDVTHCIPLFPPPDEDELEKYWRSRFKILNYDK